MRKTQSALQPIQSMIGKSGKENVGGGGVPFPLLGTCSYRVLESRMVFDGAAAATTADATDAPQANQGGDDTAADSGAAGAQEPSAVDVIAALASGATGGPAAAAGTGGPHIVFIDPAVTDPATLAAAIPSGAEVVVLDRGSDGLSQIAAALAGRTGVAGISILSHGRAGELDLGSAHVNLASISGAHSDELAAIRSALSADADILLYGCSVAEGEPGAAFVSALSAATGADVAASTDDTGAASLGGDWDLELRSGLIEAGLIDAPEWNGLLAPLVISTTALPVQTGGYGLNAVGLWTNAGTIGGTSIDIRATVISVTGSAQVQFWTSGDDLEVDVFTYGVANNAVTIRWEIFASGTNQGIYALGDPAFSIRDIDGDSFTNTAFPGVEIEAVAPSLNGLTAYTTESVSNLLTGVSGANVYAIGTQNQSGELNSMVTFNWSSVSSWEMTYVVPRANDGRVFLHDGDGDFTFVSPNTVSMLGLDLDGNNSTASGTGYQTTFTENGAAVAIVDSDVAITQNAVLGTNLGSASVRLTNAQTGDQLLVSGSAATTGTVNGLSYTISSVGSVTSVTLTGNANLATYQAALQAIAFANSSENPATTDRQIEVSVTNTTFGTTSNIALSTIHVAAVNDAPTSTDDSVTTPEDTPKVLALSDFGTYSDPEGAAIGSVKVTSLETDGSLEYFNGTSWVAVTLNQVITAADVTAGKLRFNPDLNETGSPYATVGFQVSDGTAFSTASNTLTVNVTPVNDAPTSTDDSVTTAEDTPKVLALTDFGTYSDVEGTAIASVKITSLETDGALEYFNGTSWVAVTLNQVITAADITGGNLRFNPDLNEIGSPYATVGFQVSDGTAFSAASNTLTVNVTPVNDAPTSTDDSVTTAEDTPKVLALTDFGTYSDVDGDAIAAVKITSLETDGALEYFNGTSWVAVALNQVITAADITGGNLRFNPDLNETGSPYATLGFQVSDGTAFSAASNTLTVNVTPVNDAPTSTDDSVTTAEDTPKVLALTDFGTYSDVEGTAIASVKITSLETDGALEYFDGTSWVAVTLNQVITAADITGGNLRFNPDLNEIGSPYATVGFQVSDGTAFSAASNTLTVKVTPVNDAPAGTLANQTSHDGATVSLDVGASFTDVEGDDIDYTISGLPLGLNYDPDTGLITGTVAANASQGGAGGVYTITVDASDGAATTTRTFTLTVSNLPPVAVADSGNTNEDAASVPGDVLANDHDTGPDSDSLTVTAGENASGGALTLGSEVTLPSGALLTLNANGTYVYKPNGAFEGLGTSEAATDTFSYTISDGNGGTSTATVTISIEGRNDTPVVINPLTGLPPADPSAIVPAQSGSDGAPIVPLDVTGFFDDPDASDTLSLSVDPADLPRGIVFNPLNGTFTGTPGHSASQGGPGNDGIYPVTVTATDPHGATVTTVVMFTITNPAPIAQDDDLPGTENQTLTGSVLSANGHGADSDPDGDTFSVSAVDGLAGNVGTGVTGSDGGTFTITAAGAYTFAPGTDFDDLAVGETRTTSITYTIADSEGGTDTATVTVAVNGTNDTPIVIDPLTGLPPADPNAIVPDQNGADSVAITALDVTGYFADPDTSDTLALSVDPAELPPGINFDPLTGTFSGTPGHSASQGGPAGDGVYPVTVTASDPHGATVTTVVVFAFTNPSPDAQDDDLSGTENQTFTGSVLTTNGHGADSDPDGDAISVSEVNGLAGNVGTGVIGSNGGTFTIASTGTYSFDPGADFDDLALGETRTTSVTYTITDSEGGTDTATVTVTVTGTNDTPIVIDPLTGLPPADPNAIVPDVTGDDSSAISPLDVTGFFTDPDTTDTLALSVDPADLPPGISFDPLTGTFTGTFAHDASQGGPAGDGIYPVVITATDPHGATVTTTVVFTVLNPPVDAQDDAVTVGENGTLGGSVFDDNGSGADNDPDGDTITVVAINGNGPDVGQPVSGSNGGTFTIDSDGTLAFDPGADFGDLAVGETRTTTVVYQVTDGNGAFDTATVTVTVTGANDTPIVVDPLTGLAPADPNAIVPQQAGEDGAPITPLDVTGFFTDPDTTDTLVLSVDPAALPGGISFDPLTGTFSGTPVADASQASSPGQPAGTYVIPVMATDPYGAAATTFVVFHIANPAPTAGNDTGTVSEDGPAANGDAFANDADGGGDADALRVVAVNGGTGLVGEPVTGSTGGMFTLNADGSWSFDPGADFQNLAPGETRATSITYRVSDGNGGTAEATITVTVTGANDAPVALGPIPPQASVEGAPITPIDTSVAFDNPNGEPLTYTATGLPDGLTIDPATGAITGTPGNSTSVQGPYTVLVTAVTPAGETATVAVEIGVSNPPPVAADDQASTPVDQPLTLAPLANDSDPDGDVLVISDAVQPANGTVVINPDGTLTYTPDAGFSGTETITYTITDAQGETATATITVTVGTPPADAPIALGPVSPQLGIDGAPITPIDTGTLFSDPNGGPLAFVATGLPPGLTIDPATGIVTGTLEPDASVDGPYTITVTGTDPDGNQVSTTFVLAVANPAPLAANDAVATAADTPVTVAPLANDSDPDGDALAISHVSAPLHGSVVINPDGTLTYTPDAGFTGTETLTYTVSDGEGGTDIATITISVGTPLPGAPATPIASVPAAPVDGAPISPIDMGHFVTEPDGQPLTFTATGLPDGLVIDPNTGVVSGTLEPSASAEGPYNVTVTATDPDGNQVSMMLVITPTNPPPLLQNDTAAANPDQPVTIGVLANDIDPDGDPLTVTGASDPANGSVVVNRNGTITYTPDAGFTGTDTFTYTVSDGNGGVTTATVTVDVGTPSGLAALPGIPPVTGADGMAIAPFPVGSAFGDVEDTGPLTLAVDPSALPPGIVFDPMTGTFSGTPSAHASQGNTPGEPQGTYIVPVTATDSNGATTTAYVAFSFVNLVPVAVDDAATGSEDDASITGNVLTDAVTGDHDTAPDSDPVTVVAAGQGGNVITVGVPFTTSGGGVLTLNGDGSFTFLPGTAYNGLDVGETATETIVYTISDGDGGTAVATLVITVTGANDTPVVIDPANPGPPDNPVPAVDPLNIIPDVATTDGATPTPVDAGAYIVDPDGEPLTFTATGLPPGMTIDPHTGIISGTLPAGASQSGPYVVTVTATDPDGASVQTTVTYTVANIAPVAADDAANVGEDAQNLTGNVISGPGTDHDGAPDSDPLTVVAANQNGHTITIGQPFTTSGGGVLTLNSDGSYTFEPGTSYNGLAAGESTSETVTYQISDGNGGTDTAALVITVIGANDAPVVVDPANPGPPDNPIPATDPANIIPDVSGIDSEPVTPLHAGNYFVDPDGEPLTFTATGLPPGLTIDPVTGTITGTLTSNASQGGNTGQPGEFLVTVTARDPSGATVSTTITYTIGNPPPVAVDDTAKVDEGRAVTIPVLPNDYDPDGDPLQVTDARATNGTVTIRPDGSLVYTPRPGFSGTDVIRYTISDGNGGTAIASVRVEVVPATIPMLAGPYSPNIPVNALEPPPSLQVGGAVLSSANGIDIGNGSPSFINGPFLHVAGQSLQQGPVSSALGQFQSLNGIPSMLNVLSLRGLPPFHQGHGIVGVEAHRLAQLWSAFASRDPWSSHGVDAGDIEGLTGFSLKYGLPEGLAGLGQQESISIESLVRGRVLMLNVQKLGDLGGKEIVAFRYKTLGGVGLPSWLEAASDGFLIGERPADLETIRLTVEAVLDDGSVLRKDVEINAVTGAIRALGGERRADLAPMFTRQFTHAPRLDSGHIDALARVLAS